MDPTLKLAVGGVLCGILIAAIVAFCEIRQRPSAMRSLATSGGIAFCLATIGLIAMAFLGEVHSDISKHGYPLFRALYAGVGSAFLIAFGAPLVCGLPALVSAMVAQGLWLMFRMKCRAEPSTGGERATRLASERE